MIKDIAILLPYKETYTKNSAGAASIWIKDYMNKSSLSKNSLIYGNIDKSEKPLTSNFKNISLNDSFFSKTKSYMNFFYNDYKKFNFKIIEIHNRPEYIGYIKKYFPNTKIKIIFHNDPLSLRGSTSLSERENIINDCSHTVFISSWIKQRFFSGFKNVNLSLTKIIPHGVKKAIKIDIKNKKKNILFVGKLNRAKGYHIFCEAAKKFKKFDPSWNFIAIGNESRKNIFPNPNIVKEIGYKKNSDVLNYYLKSEIAIGNSVWDEPLGRIAIEASSRKCLPIISNKAGLAESKNIAIVLKKNNSDEILMLLKRITNDKHYRQNNQNIFYKNNNFDLKKISNRLDEIRKDTLIKSSNKIEDNKKRVLHIANFNESSDGRLYYSFSNKLNNGFIKNNYIVQTIGDRFFLKSNRSILQPFNPVNKLNEKILDTLKNFSPHILLIGHVFNISEKVFSYCIKNNIKVCSWYIDSVSPEFLKDATRNNFFRNLKFVDYCFITSSPSIFKNNRFYKKLKFIPNPVDEGIDNYKNFEKKFLEYDVFVAISHGQNRGILKKGKSDERENLINHLISELPEGKFAQFGINNFEPVWGANYYHYLSKTKMALNISRGKYQNVYSSDRISSLIGNGLLVFINANTNFNKILSSNDVVFLNNLLINLMLALFLLQQSVD